MKIVRNACYGGFGLSELALSRLSEITGKSLEQCREEYRWGDDDIRTASELVQVVEKLGEKVNDNYSKLEVVKVPDDVDWYIDDYDGYETIAEKHRRW